MIHADDASRLGIEDGGRILIGNRQGEVALDARITSGQQPGTVIVESIWPNADFSRGMGINVLISDEPAAPNGGAVFHDTAIWMRSLQALQAIDRDLIAAE